MGGKQGEGNSDRRLPARSRWKEFSDPCSPFFPPCNPPCFSIFSTPWGVALEEISRTGVLTLAKIPKAGPASVEMGEVRVGTLDSPSCPSQDRGSSDHRP